MKIYAACGRRCVVWVATIVFFLAHGKFEDKSTDLTASVRPELRASTPLKVNASKGLPTMTTSCPLNHKVGIRAAKVLLRVWLN